MIALHGVSKVYGKRAAVAAVDLELRQGERVALVGHNGAGKSTLIKLMLGLVRPTSGRVELLGANPADRGAIRARSHVGYLPENVALQPTLTGEELLAFYARLKHQPVAKNAGLLERVGIAHAARWRVGTYSKGMRQRLALAQALIGDPRVLLLDEPTTGLDPALRQTFYAIIRDLSLQGVTVLLSSHALTELEGQTDRVVVMNQGRKVADGTLAELRRLARRPVRIRFTLHDDHVTLFPRIAGTALEWRRVSERTFEVACAEQKKVEVVRQFTNGTLALADVEILTPSLDEIYAHFLFAEAAE
jgi:Cu-processing system ATP-binding protein